MFLRIDGRSVTLASFVLLACGGGEADPSASSAAAPPPSGPAATPSGATVVEPPPAPSPAPAAAAAPADEWLVWFLRDGRFTTRWIDLANEAAPLVAERHALVLSDGARLWRVHRVDAEVDVIGCDCVLEQEHEPGACGPIARLSTPGLAARELMTGAVTTIRAASGEPVYGGDIELGIEIVGGVGSRLLYQWRDSGYYCGAHGMTESADVVFDLAAGKVVEDPFVAVQRALPAGLLQEAGTQVLDQLRECDPGLAPSLDHVIDEDMGLIAVHVGLSEGVPRLSWSFEAEVYYACSADYAAHGGFQSGLLEAAAPLGLGGPLPAGLLRELARVGDVATVGWAKLSLSGEGRAAALAAFGRSAEDPWPPGSYGEVAITVPAVAAGASAAATEEAKGRLSEGRTLTRVGDYPAAIASFDAAIALDPQLARAWSERGYARLLAGDLAGARADLEHALPLDEGAAYRAAIHYNLGLVAERGGDAKGAQAAFERSLTLRESTAVRKALARVQ